MRKRLLRNVLCLVTLLALLTGCGNQAPKSTGTTGNGNGSEVDYNQYINANGSYAVTDSAYFICDAGKLQFLESSLQSPVTLLCAKADCDHQDPDQCSAYLPLGSPSLYTWNGALYYDVCEAGKISIYQMDLSGQNRKLAATLPIVSETGSLAYLMDLACGHLEITFYDDTPAGEVITIYLFSMEDLTAEPVEVYTNRNEVSAQAELQENLPRPVPVCLSQDWAFYCLELGEPGARKFDLYGYQISTGENKLLVKDDYSPPDDLSAVGNELHWYDTDGALYTVDLTTGACTKNADIPVDPEEYGALDDQWLYVTGGTSKETAEVAVYALDGTEVQRLSCADIGTPLSYAFSTADRVFFREAGFSNMDPICYLEKSALSQNNGELIPLKSE